MTFHFVPFGFVSFCSVWRSPLKSGGELLQEPRAENNNSEGTKAITSLVLRLCPPWVKLYILYCIMDTLMFIRAHTCMYKSTVGKWEQNHLVIQLILHTCTYMYIRISSCTRWAHIYSPNSLSSWLHFPYIYGYLHT